MPPKQCLLPLFVFILNNYTNAQNDWVSPCPRLFSYETMRREPNKWYGLITLLSDIDLNGIWMRVGFDKQVISVGNWFGEVVTSNYQDFLIKNPQYKLKAYVPQTVRFYVEFDPKESPPPKLEWFRLNARPVCPETVTTEAPPLVAVFETSASSATNSGSRSSTTPTPQPSATDVAVISNNANGEWVSPCPRLFSYETKSMEPNKWYGLMTLLSDIDLAGVWVRLGFDKPVKSVGNWFGQVVTSDQIDFLLKNPQHKIKAYVPETVRFYVEFDPNESPPPKLEWFRLNAKPVCPETVTTEAPPLFTYSSTDSGSSSSTTPTPQPPATDVAVMSNNAKGEWVSPCPRLFSYETKTREPNKWYGLMTLLSDIDLTGVWVRVGFDKPVKSVGNWFGQVVTSNQQDFLVKNPQYKLKAYVPQTVRFYVEYDPNESPPPKLEWFRLNAKPVCPESLTTEAPPLFTFSSMDLGSIFSTTPTPQSSTTDIAVISNNAKGEWVSPCPRLFSYDTKSREPNKWYGLMTLLSDIDLAGVWVRLGFDKPVKSVGNWFGQVVTSDQIDFLLKNPQHKIKAYVPETVRFYVEFDPNESPPPKLEWFRLNAKPVCPETVTTEAPPLFTFSSMDLGSVSSTTPTPQASATDVAVISNNAKGEWVSPCPRLFSYETKTREPNKWYGLMTLLSDIDLTGVWVRVGFDKPVKSVGNWFGQVVTSNQQDFLVKNPQYKLKAYVPQTVRFYVEFDPNESPPPKLEWFRLNAKPVCPETVTTEAPPLFTFSSPDLGSIPSTTPTPQPSATDVAVISNNAKGEWVSPCPRLFSYETKTREPNKWYGLMTLLSDIDLTGVWVRVGFDKPVKSVGNWFGQVVTSNQQDFLVKNPQHKLKAYVPQTVRFYVEYDPNDSPPPKLEWFRLNAKPVCPETVTTEAPPLFTFSSTDLGSMSSTTPIPQYSATDPDEGSRNNENSDDICGTVIRQPSPLITNAQETAEGEFPWHAAVYHAKGLAFAYVCGGSLITKQHVITAARCVTKSKSTKPIVPSNLFVFLGKHHLKLFTDAGFQHREVAQVKPHPEYNGMTLKNDIAILKLAMEASITDYVRPVCLWQDPPDLSTVLGKQGRVAGWGLDETGALSEELMQAKMPVVSEVTCIRSDPEFYARYTFDRTYCAGFKSGTSVCNSDSGGGMVFPKAGSNSKHPKWQLRGVVSISEAFESGSCDTSNYVVFTDAAKYHDWIRDSIK